MRRRCPTTIFQRSVVICCFDAWTPRHLLLDAWTRVHGLCVPWCRQKTEVGRRLVPEGPQVPAKSVRHSVVPFAQQLSTAQARHDSTVTAIVLHGGVSKSLPRYCRCEAFIEAYNECCEQAVIRALKKSATAATKATQK